MVTQADRFLVRRVTHLLHNMHDPAASQTGRLGTTGLHRAGRNNK
jgi:hypothetical protein